MTPIGTPACERDPPVLVAGGGIGGLCAALSLARRGRRVRVLEQADSFAELGAGIQLSPNCTRVLLDLGLGEALARIGFLPEAVEVRDFRRGTLISATPLGRTALETWGAPYVHVHRGDLLAALVEAASAEPGIELVAARRVEWIEDAGDRVRVGGPGFETEGELLVGADGIHSRVRAQLFGADAPRFTGNVAWRALVPTERLPDGLIRPVAGAWWGPGRHFVHYYVRGGALVNCVCVVERDDWREESWTERGERSELQAEFADWHADIQTLIEHMEPDSLHRWALFDRLPMPAWSRGRVTLLGDACHPTLPFMAQGAAMAIEDGAVLARCLAATTSPTDALARYEAVRQPRTARVQAGSRRNAQVFHMRGVIALARNLAARRAAAVVSRGLYEYDPLTVPIDEPVGPG